MTTSNALPSRFEAWRDAVFGIDLRSLALFRIALGALLLADVAYHASEVPAFLSDQGVMPLAAWSEIVGFRWSLHAMSPGTTLQYLLLALEAVCAAAFLVGWHARLAGIAAWALLASVQHRNPFIMNGGDEVLRLILFWSLFLPIGARFSLDARRDGRLRSLPERTVSLASAALLLQVVLIYPASVVFKRRGEAWQSLDFLEHAMAVDGLATDLGRLLLELAPILPALSFGALQLESFGWLLAFSPVATRRCRLLAALTFAGFHLFGIGITFRIGLFSAIMATAWIPFVPFGAWRREDTPSPGAPHRPPRWLDAVAAVLILLTLLMNAHAFGWIGRPPGYLAAHAIRLDQRWSLYSGVMSNRFYVFPAQLESGGRVDLHRGAPLDWSTPRIDTPHTRWWKLLLLTSRRPKLREPVAGGLARRFERAHPGERVQRVELWMWEQAAPGSDAWRPIFLWSPDGVPRLHPPGAKQPSYPRPNAQ